MSAGLPLPKQVFGHGFLLSRGEKMSKSVGNVVDPLELADAFGVDQLRYFLLREVTLRPGRQLQRRGDRQPRQCRPRQQLRQSRPAHFVVHRQELRRHAAAAEGRAMPPTTTLLATGRRAVTRTDMPAPVRGISRCRRASRRGCKAVFACNQYIDAQAPWALRKTDPERMIAVLAHALRGDPRPRDRDRAGHPELGGAGCSTRWAFRRTSASYRRARATTGSYARLAASDFRLAPPDADLPAAGDRPRSV